MNDLNRCNKVTGTYWLNKSTTKLKIKLKLKQKSGLISLPKFEDYSDANTNLKLEENIQEYVFEWQEKKFSAWEICQYGDIVNCVSEKDVLYHNMIKNKELKPSKVFSYINEDYCKPLPFDYKKKNQNCGLSLRSIMQHLNLNEKVCFGRNSNKSDSMMHIFKNEEYLDDDKQWIAMHIAYDNSDYDEYSQRLINQEATLISLYYNLLHNYMIVSPDINNLEFNPYDVVTDDGIHLNCHYEVDINFDGDESGEELMLLLRKLYKKWDKKHKHLINFVMPPLGVKKYYIMLEILSATHFDMDNLYIEYHIKIPESIKCNNNLEGKTHTSKSITLEKFDQCNFGHLIELELDVNSDTELSHIKIFFEVISTDWWSRHRTEGYSYLALSLDPGSHSKQLSCSRPEEIDKIEAETRRFFVGGCNLIKDLEVLAKPQVMDANFTFQTTGSIKLRWNVILQSPSPGAMEASAQPGTSSSSALLLGAEAALRKYSKARAKLVAATKDLEVTYEMH